MVLLVSWLAYAGLMRWRGHADAPAHVLRQTIMLGVMLALSAGAWFALGLRKTLDFDDPKLLLIALGVIPIFVLGAMSLQQLDAPRRWASVYLRMLVLLLIVAMLAGFRTIQRHDELTVIVLMDHSESVRRYAQPPAGAIDPATGQRLTIEQWMDAYALEAAGDKPLADYFGSLVFDGRSTVRSRPRQGDARLPEGVIEQPIEGTHLQHAIEAAMAAKSRSDTALRLLLISDGNETAGNALQAADAAAALGIPIDVVLLNYDVQNEVMIEGLYAPAQSREGQTVPLRVVMRATTPMDGFVQITHNGQVIDMGGPDTDNPGRFIAASQWRHINADDEVQPGQVTGDYILDTIIDRPVTIAGINRFEAIFESLNKSPGMNAVTANDRAQAVTLVAGHGKILIVDGVPRDPETGARPGRVLGTTLAEHGIKVDTLGPGVMPGSPEALQEYDAIIFQNVSADDISPAIQKNLTQYVHDQGGGFIMIGGEDSFGAGGWTNTVIDKYVLPVSCEISAQSQLPTGALVLVIDRSGSMFGPMDGTGGGGSESSQNVAAEAAVLAISTLYTDDMLGVIAFSSNAQWIVELGDNDDPAGAAERVRSLKSGGGTNIGSGLKLAYDALENIPMQQAAIRHVILITDGHSSPFDADGLIEKYHDEGITLTTIGVGPGHDAQLLAALAREGGGDFYPVDDPLDLPQVFIKEARVIRRNLLREFVFAPTVRNTGSPIMTHITTMPPLEGFVLTGPRTTGRRNMVHTPIVGPEGEPIFAHHQVGLGRAGAFTSDAHNRWAQQWLTWPGYADFWARTVRYIARPPASLEADLSTTIENDTLIIRLDAAGDLDFTQTGESSAAFGNNLSVTGFVMGPDNQSIPITLEQTGPGIYELRMPANNAGNYIVDLQMASPDGQQRRRVIGSATHLAGGELRNFESNLALLTQIAQRTGGRILDPSDPAAARLFNRDTPIETLSSRSLWHSLMPFLLALLLLDIACRRIAWDAHEIGDWAKGRLNSLAGIFSPRKVENKATLAALKAKHAQTSAQLHPTQPTSTGAKPAAEQTPAPPTTPIKPAVPTTAKARKFVASKEDLAQAKDDFTDAVGGAKEGGDAKPTITAAMRKSEKNQGPTTSRLLDAKRRAQQRLNEEEDKSK